MPTMGQISRILKSNRFSFTNGDIRSIHALVIEVGKITKIPVSTRSNYYPEGVGPKVTASELGLCWPLFNVRGPRYGQRADEISDYEYEQIVKVARKMAAKRPGKYHISHEAIDRACQVIDLMEGHKNLASNVLDLLIKIYKPIPHEDLPVGTITEREVFVTMTKAGLECGVNGSSVLFKALNKMGLGRAELSTAINLVLARATGESIFGGPEGYLDVIQTLKDISSLNVVPSLKGSVDIIDGLSHFETVAINNEFGSEDRQFAIDAFIFFKDNCRHVGADSKAVTVLKMMNYNVTVDEMKAQVDPAERQYPGMLLNAAMDAKSMTVNKEVFYIPDYNDEKVYVIYHDKARPADARKEFGFEQDDFDAPVGSVSPKRLDVFNLDKDNSTDFATAKALVNKWKSQQRK